MLIDYHAHVNFNAYKDDADEVIKRAHEAGVFMVLVGSQIDTSRRAVEIAARYEKGVWAAVGLHPIHLVQMEVDEEEDHFATRAEIFDPAAYRALTQNPKVVAIGECGLDYFHATDSHRISDKIATDYGWKERQHETLRQHLELAHELDLPLILHCRGSKADPQDAYRDQLTILREYVQAGKLKRRGAIHCFISTWEIAQQYLELGFYIGFTGVITFPRPSRPRSGSVGQARPSAYDEVVKNTPLGRILVETDCPYLAPVPHRGKRNEPLFVRYVAEKVAEIKGMENEKVEAALFENTLKVFYKIPAPRLRH